MDEAVYKDFFVDGSIEGTNFNTSLDSLVLKGFKYNYKALFEALGNIESQQDPTALVPALVQTGYNYEFSEIRAENFNFALPDMKGNFKMASLAFGPRTVREQGPNVASKMSMTFNGMEVFTLDAIGLDKMILSDVMVDFIQNPEAYMKDMNFLMQVMEDPFMLFKGMRMENLYVKNLNAQGMASLANWQADVAMDDTVHIQSKLQSLYLSPMALRQMGMLMYGTGGYGQDILGMLAMRPDGVTADSNFKLDINIAKSSINFDTDFDLTLRQMGSLLFKMAGVTGEPDYYETYGDPLVSNLEISLKDSGILESLYSYMSSQGGASSNAAAKAALLDEVDSQLANADAMEARVLQGLRVFLDQGGRLSIMMQPNRPMPMSDEVFFQMPEAYNLEIRHTPN